MNIDETGHKQNNGGERLGGRGVSGLTCTRSITFHPRRIVEVLIETLGSDFAGVIGCDYFGAYRKYMSVC